MEIVVPTMHEILKYARNGKKPPPIAGAAPLAVDGVFFTKGLGHLNDGTIDWDDNSTTTIRCALATTTYVPNIETDEFYNPAFNANEVPNATGYTTKGVALTARSVDVATSRTVALKTTTNPSWTSATFSFRYAIVYKDTGTATTSPVIFIVDCNHVAAANLTVTSGTLTITWDATGCAKYNEGAYQT